MGVTVRQKQPEKGSPWWVFINHQGKRKAKKVGDKKTAEAVAAKIREKMKLGELKIEEEKETPLFKDYAEEWFNGHVKVYCKPSTAEDYETHIKKHLNPAFATKPINQIQRRDIKKFISFIIL